MLTGETVPGDSDSSDSDDMDEEDEEEEDDDQFEDAEEEDPAANSTSHSTSTNTTTSPSSQLGLGLTGARPRLCIMPLAGVVVTTTASAPCETRSTMTLGHLYEYDRPSPSEVSQKTATKPHQPEYLRSLGTTVSPVVSTTSPTISQMSKSPPSIRPPFELVKVKPTDSNSSQVVVATSSTSLSSSSPQPVQLQTYLQERAVARARTLQDFQQGSSPPTSSPHQLQPHLGATVSRYGSVDIIKSTPPHVTIDRVRTPEKNSSFRPLPLLQQQPHDSPNSVVITKTGPVVSSISAVSAVPKDNNIVLDDGSFAPRNVTMNVKDLPTQITRRKSPVAGSSGAALHLVPNELNTMAQMKAATNAKFASKQQQHPSSVATPAAVAASSAAAAASHIPSSTMNRIFQSIPSAPSATVAKTSAPGEIGPKEERSNKPPSSSSTSGSNKSSCNICQKVFNKASQLRIHMNIHYMERPYKCEDCSISFRTQV